MTEDSDEHRVSIRITTNPSPEDAERLKELLDETEHSMADAARVSHEWSQSLADIPKFPEDFVSKHEARWREHLSNGCIRKKLDRLKQGTGFEVKNQRTLMKMVGLQEQTVTQWASGQKEIRLSDLTRLSLVINVPMMEIIGETTHDEEALLRLYRKLPRGKRKVAHDVLLSMLSTDGSGNPIDRDGNQVDEDGFSIDGETGHFITDDGYIF